MDTTFPSFVLSKQHIKGCTVHSDFSVSERKFVFECFFILTSHFHLFSKPEDQVTNASLASRFYVIEKLSHKGSYHVPIP